MNYSGHRADFVYVDEMKSHTADAFEYAMQSARTIGWSPPQQVPKPVTLQPLDVPCSACGAIVGERCNRGHDPRSGKKRYRGFHFRRKDDARLATEAVRALNPA